MSSSQKSEGKYTSHNGSDNGSDNGSSSDNGNSNAANATTKH